MAKSNEASGIGFGGLLAIVFIVLKLTNVISWPWLWVLAPIWIPMAIALVGLGGSLLYSVIKDKIGW